MDELLAEIDDLIGAPPPGQEMLAAVAVSLRKSEIRADLDDVVTDIANSVIAGLTRGRTSSDAPASGTRAGFNIRLARAQQDAIDRAHEQLGISHHMVWALNARHLFIFKRAALGERPRRMTGRHAYRDIELVDVGHPAGVGDRTVQITLHGLPITVAVDEDDVVDFAKVLQRQLRSRTTHAVPPAEPAEHVELTGPSEPIVPIVPIEPIEPIDPSGYEDLA